ncbi:hypothetical protein [Acuticoccus sp.]|uniref:hypothetical protein n=1 Tax=Acuticoccus sp. TaxID=1904378 RepID=UPI003B52D662
MLPLLQLVLLALAIINLSILIGESPAADQTARQHDPSGDWRTDGVLTLYDRAAYDREKALDLLVALAQHEDAALAERALVHAQASVRRAPADALAWNLLAWSHALVGAERDARAALGRTFALAPHGAALARDRLLLAEALRMDEVAKKDATVRTALARDLAAVGRRDEDARQAVPTLIPKVVDAVAGPDERR